MKLLLKKKILEESRVLCFIFAILYKHKKKMSLTSAERDRKHPEKKKMDEEMWKAEKAKEEREFKITGWRKS